MQKLSMISWLGVVSFAALPSFAQTRPVVADDVAGVHTTYTPSDASSSADVYASERGSAVRTARGRGPAQSNAVLHTRTIPSSEHGRTRLESDNQTRRAGALNYKGGVNVRTTGGDFALYTFGGADTTTPRRDAKFTQWARTPDGAMVPLAPSAPIAWDSGMLAPDFTRDRVGSATLASGDMAELPTPGDGTASTQPGLLAMHSTLQNMHFIDNDGIASARPVAMDASTGFPAVSRAIGGGPGDESPVVRFAEDHVTR